MAVVTSAFLNAVQEKMVAIANGGYVPADWNLNSNTITVDVGAGSTVNGNTFATAGTYTVTPTYTTTANTAGYPHKSLSWEGTLGTEETKIIDALFALKPKLRKRFKGDQAEFKKALIAAAEERYALNALDTLRGPLALDQ